MTGPAGFREERLGLVVDGDAAHPHPLPQSGRLVIGSSPQHAQLVVAGEGVEGAHCAIGRQRAGGWAVKDLGTRRGTLVNGLRVDSQRLAAGDELVLGARRLTLVVLPAPPAAEGAGPAAEQGRGAGRTRLGGYRIERALGRGRMGIVVLAVQESLSRPVALKLLDPRLAADLDFVRRFRAEAEAAAALNHPNVVTVHDFGEADGRRFLAMEYMPGGSLEDELARGGRLGWRRVLDVLHDAGAALEYAEARGIVHRDIKPANLMLGAGGLVKLADLGLATTVTGGGTAGGEERVFGTPHFVSPEQARGAAPDHQSDLYSLGATAYRLLTGRTPFDGTSTRAILRAQLLQDPPPPRSLVPEIPVALEALVLRLLAKEPARRPPSARALLQEVDALRAAAGAERWAAPPVARGRRRWIALLGTGVLGALLLLGALVLAARRLAPDADLPATATTLPAPGALAAQDGAPFLEPAPPQDPYAPIEAQLAELERAAREAFAALPAESEPELRLSALRDLAQRFPGTSSGARARRAADDLAARQGADAARTLELAAEARATADDLRRAIGWPAPPDDPRTLAELLDALQAQRPAGSPGAQALPGEAGEAREADEARAAVAQEIAAQALAHLRAGLAQADELAQAGRFDELAPLFAELARRHEPPQLAPDEPTALAELRAALDATRARADELALERERWLAQAAALDRARLGSAFGPQSGFLEHLRALDLEALERALEPLAPELRSAHARALVQALAADVRAARAALAALVASFDDPGWRRRSVVDVQSGRGSASVVAASAAGLVLEGRPELVPWSRFGAHAAWLEQLFHERLERAWSAQEGAQVAALLRLAATAEAAGLARAALASEEVAGAELLAAFEPCRDWNAALGVDDPRLAQELESARAFLAATRAASESAWSLAAANTSALLERADRSLFVALLCDGSTLETVPAPAAEAPRTGER